MGTVHDMSTDLDLTAMKVTFTVDGEEFCVDAWPDLSALRTIRDVAGHPRPRRGCEMGLCGSCESKVDGVERRLCQMASMALDGVVIETPAPRRSMFAV